MSDMPSVTERLAGNSYALDEEDCHIVVDQEVVRKTGIAELLVRICPAHVYGIEPDGTVSVTYAACLECGTCRAVATPGALRWQYPRGGFGVAYREG